MPRTPNRTDLETAIQDAADDFIAQILKLVRGATVDELAALTTATTTFAAHKRAEPKDAPKRRGRPPKVDVAEAPARKPGRPPKVREEEPPKTKERKKRAWPKCSVKGCEKNVYMPSGAAKMCYQHYLKQGGKPSPLVAYRKKQSDDKEGKKPAAKKPAKKKTVLRKAADKKTV